MQRLSRRLAAIAAAGALAGCLAAPDGANPGLGLGRNAPDKVTVAGGSVVIGGPRGYCVDKGGSRLNGQSAFVLLASCYSITQNPNADAPVVPAILTASVAEQTGAAPATEAALDQLAQFLASPGGRATLARDGRAESVEILQSRRVGGAVLLRLRDGSTNPTPGLQQTYWRGFFDLDGRLITISVIGFESQPLPAERGLTTLRNFLARIRAETANLTGDRPLNAATLPRKRLFGGLFN